MKINRWLEINSKSIYEDSNFPESGEGREMGWHIKSCQSRRPTWLLKVKDAEDGRVRDRSYVGEALEQSEAWS